MGLGCCRLQLFDNVDGKVVKGRGRKRILTLSFVTKGALLDVKADKNAQRVCVPLKWLIDDRRLYNS